MTAVSLEEVRRVAELANLELTPAEEPAMLRDLTAILGHVAQLAELDTSAVPAMAQIADILPANILPATILPAVSSDGFGASLRVDAVRPSLDRRAVMSSAPESDGRFFKVPKVIER